MVAGRFVSVEGIDASGKSTLASRLVESLARDGRPARLLDRATVIGMLDGYPARHMSDLCELIWGYPKGARTSELGFDHWTHLLAAWFHAVDGLVIRPAVADGAVLVADSWLFKFTARFALTVGLPDAERVFDGIVQPDRVVWLDVAPEICAGRRSEFRTTELGEWQGFDERNRAFITYQGRVREVYERLADAHSWHRIDAVRQTDVLAAALAAVADPTPTTVERKKGE
ncbi:hypothetical protein [Streptosporangium sp. NPDC051022]|uniref:dTMP kinase n=1 Tax=Streptosporangium sp. NPDC051022 TaxID=3155752 RepID=UPI00343309F3